MKTKVFKFQDGKRNESYIEEIKQIMRKNENVDTQASFDENGNYVVKVLIPDWRDKFRKDSLEAIRRKQMESSKVQRIISQTEIIIMDGIGKSNKESPLIPVRGIKRTSPKSQERKKDR